MASSALVAQSGSCNTECNTNCFRSLRTTVHYRSQGANTARELVGWQWEINKPDMCENYGCAYLAFEYQRSFREKQLAEALFGDSCLRFAGSAVTDRQPNELLADYFGLATDFRGRICFKPRIENYIVDLGLYIGLDSWTQGLYLRFHAPFVHARWTLDTCNGRRTFIESGSFNPDGSIKQFAPCYMANDAVNTAESITQALSGRFLFGNMQMPWCAGQFDFCRQTLNGLADIDVILGYNFINDDCYHFGLYAQAVLPTGKKQKDLFVFSPVVGNGRFFELGAGISAHTVLWSGEDSNVALFLEGNVTHFFNSRQCRLFDLKDNGPFSRYMLLKEFDTNGTTFSYAGNLISATCFTNRKVKVNIPVKGDASLKLAYRWCGLGIDIGYNIYGQSHEKIKVPCDSCPVGIDRRKFAIKGTEGTCCFDYLIANVPSDGSTTATIFPDGTTFPASATAPTGCEALPDDMISVVTKLPNNGGQPNATAFQAGTPVNMMLPANACDACINTPITSPTPVSDLSPANGFYVKNGAQPRLLSVNDLNIRSGEAHSLVTHKLFVFFSYTWMDECGWNPSLGVGGEFEFDGNHFRSSCERTGASQWGVLVKGNISF